MDFQLERFEGSLAGRMLHRTELGYERAPGDTRLACSRCGTTVGWNIPLGGIRKIVFECRACGARSTVGRNTPYHHARASSPGP